MKLASTIILLYKKIIAAIKCFLITMGTLFLVSIILSFTDYPFWAYYKLGTYNSGLSMQPSVIVLLGGGGMPGPDGLIRAYYTALSATENNEAKIIIALPPDLTSRGIKSSFLIANEIIMRGVDSCRISFEEKGHDTHSQAINIANTLKDTNLDSMAVQLITSPEHMYRAVATFRKAGFAHVGGIASFEEDIDPKLLIMKGQKKDRTDFILDLRYNTWNYLEYEIIVLREYCAIAYYKLRGWV